MTSDDDFAKLHADRELASAPAADLNPRDYYCEAVPRQQFEASSWGDANVGCGRRGATVVGGHIACRMHAPEDKRYGWNARRSWTGRS